MRALAKDRDTPAAAAEPRREAAGDTAGDAPEHSGVDMTLLNRLQSDDTLWDLQRIADELDVALQTVNQWRWRALQKIDAEQPVPTVHNMLPPPDVPYPNKPLWHAGTIRTWAMQVGRMLPDGKPQRLRAGRQPKPA